jgi:hypothetical protein
MVFSRVGREFAGHSSCSLCGEYARMGGLIHSSTGENVLSIFQRG